MNGDLLFRILFLVLFLPGVSIRGYYARKVRATQKRRSIKERLEDTVQAEGKAGAILLIARAHGCEPIRACMLDNCLPMHVTAVVYVKKRREK